MIDLDPEIPLTDPAAGSTKVAPDLRRSQTPTLLVAGGAWRCCFVECPLGGW